MKAKHFSTEYHCIWYFSCSLMSNVTSKETNQSCYFRNLARIEKEWFERIRIETNPGFQSVQDYWSQAFNMLNYSQQALTQAIHDVLFSNNQRAKIDALKSRCTFKTRWVFMTGFLGKLFKNIDRTMVGWCL